MPKLIKSSIYKVGEILARYTGRMADEVPIFSSHGTEIASLNYGKASLDEVRIYLGR